MEEPEIPQQENPENLQKPEELKQVPQYVPPTESPEDIIAREERGRADATRLAEIRVSLDRPPEEMQPESIPEKAIETPIEKPGESLEMAKAELDSIYNNLNSSLKSIIEAAFLKNLGQRGSTDSERVSSIRSLEESQHFSSEFERLLQEADSFAMFSGYTKNLENFTDIRARERNHKVAIDDVMAGIFNNRKIEEQIRKYYRLKQRVESLNQ